MSTPSLWTDVRVSTAHTDALVHELVAAAAAVEAALALLAPEAIHPTDWGGPFRLGFDDEAALVVSRGRELAAALLASARDASTALAAGQGEQQFRERLRHQVELETRPAGAS